MFIVEINGIRKEGVGDVYSGDLRYKEGRGCRGS